MKIPLFTPFLLAAALALPASAGLQPLRLQQKVDPAYPRGLEIYGITRGIVRCVIHVDQRGEMEDLLITTYTHEAFAREVREAVNQWRFLPARLDGVPVPAQTVIEFNFEATGVVISMDTNLTIDSLLRLMGISELAYRPSSLKELDRIPVPVRTVKPNTDMPLQVICRVTVDFYIDESGKVRVPFVTAADNPDPRLTSAAVLAVQQWQFETPLRNGRPTLVLARQVFEFRPNS